MTKFTDKLHKVLIASLLFAGVGTLAVIGATCALIQTSTGSGAQPPSPTVVPTEAAATPTKLPPTATAIAAPGLVLPFVWPADGNVSQAMTPKHPTGIDIAAPIGSEVRAVRDGVVFFAGGDPCCSYGLYIAIGHDSGWSSIYGHLSKFLVKPGDQVRQGQVIALSGETGHAIGAHLHFELRSLGRPVDPLDHFWPARPVMPDDSTATPPPRGPGAPPASWVNAPTAVPQPAALSAGEATVLAIGWMSQHAEFAYQIDASTCYAMAKQINWLVTCQGTLQGCAGVACQAYLAACVLGQPVLITRFCP